MFLNVVEVFVDDKVNVKVGVRFGILFVVDKGINIVFEDEICIENGNVKIRKSKIFFEMKDIEIVLMIIVFKDWVSIEGWSKDI